MTKLKRNGLRQNRNRINRNIFQQKNEQNSKFFTLLNIVFAFTNLQNDYTNIFNMSIRVILRIAVQMRKEPSRGNLRLSQQEELEDKREIRQSISLKDNHARAQEQLWNFSFSNTQRVKLQRKVGLYWEWCHTGRQK